MKKVSNTLSQNKALVLEHLYRTRISSRIEISSATGLTPATVTNIVSDLLTFQIVIETGDETSAIPGSGRRRKELTLNSQAGYVIGLEINMKGIYATVTDIIGTVLKRDSIATNDYSVKNINSVIVELIRGLISNFSTHNILGIGLTIPGHFDQENQKIISNNKMWSFFNLLEIKKEIPLPFIVENNIVTMALGEYLFRPSNTPDKFLFFHIGHGLFCSFFNSEDLRIKDNYYIGEIGHTVVDINGPKCECGKKGCLQTYISDTWLLKNAHFVYEHSDNTVLHHLISTSDDLSMETILNAYKLGDKFFRQQFSLGIRLLSTSIANAMILVDADKIYLNSEWLSHREFQDQIIALVKEQLQFIPTKRHTEIDIIEFDPFRGAQAACALALFTFFIKHPQFNVM